MARKRSFGAKFLIKQKIGRIAAEIISFGMEKIGRVAVAVILSDTARIRRVVFGMVW